MNDPQSCEKNFHQSIYFQRAIGQVIEISRPLHVAFHVLQTTCIIFGSLLTWSVKVVEWKKIMLNKTLAYFQNARQLAFIVPEEA